ncbi:hypothetical protein CLFE_045830 (plasmid) [Clostridium felsineum DSM 794]|nr:hypothetical protein CLFE_045830 [Clostridium felsineum DSM 794]
MDGFQQERLQNIQEKIILLQFVAVLIGILLYSKIPLVSELTRTGVSMRTSLAFMMAVIGFSIPEGILL